MKQDKLPFRGVATALITPFRDGKIDHDALRLCIEHQIQNGIAALVLCGTTGEPATLSVAERCQLLEFSMECIGGRCPVLVGNGSPDTARALEYTAFAEALGADALLTVTPYYNKGTHAGVVEHFRAIARATSLPILLYNVPTRTGTNLSFAQLDALMSEENIVGIKEACADMERMGDLSTRYGDRFAIYSGNDSLLLPSLAIGGMGGISVLSNLYPREMQKICTLFWDGRTEEACQLQRKLYKMARLLFRDTSPSPVKYAASLMGLCRAELRLPLTPPDAGLQEELKEEYLHLSAFFSEGSLT